MIQYTLSFPDNKFGNPQNPLFKGFLEVAKGKALDEVQDPTKVLIFDSLAEANEVGSEYTNLTGQQLDLNCFETTFNTVLSDENGNQREYFCFESEKEQSSFLENCNKNKKSYSWEDERLVFSNPFSPV